MARYLVELKVVSLGDLEVVVKGEKWADTKAGMMVENLVDKKVVKKAESLEKH
jgi:hypothetical protein